MRLLFDENLSARLAADLRDLYPDSLHVTAAGLAGASDREVWDFAGKNGLILVTRDEDFHRLSVLYGPPPKVVWIRLGNCRTADVARVLRTRVDDIQLLSGHAETGFLALG
jgi:predicted nuclease of predicted toxin-antitoxin system